MPTDEWFKENPKVSAYIPQDLNEKLLEWMKGKNIKKVSQALTTILEEHLGVVQTEPSVQAGRDDRLEALEQKFENLSQVVQGIKEAIQVSSLQVVQSESKQETLPLLEAIAAIETEQPINALEEEIQDDEPDEILYEFLEAEDQAPNKVTNENIDRETKREQQEQSSLTHATDRWMTTGEAYAEAQRRGYTKSIGTFRRSIKGGTMPFELEQIGLMGDWGVKSQGNPKDNSVRWLKFQSELHPSQNTQMTSESIALRD